MTVGLKTWDCLPSADSTEGSANSSSPPSLANLAPAKSSENFNNSINNIEPITSTSSSASDNSHNHNISALKKHLKAPPKSGRNHAGAKYLASQYTSVKRAFELTSLIVSIPLIFLNSYFFLFYFDIKKWYFIFPAASNLIISF